MRSSVLFKRFVFSVVMITMLACGPIAQQGATPTPTKTPRRLQSLATLTPTATVSIQATAVPVEEVPTETPVPAEAVPEGGESTSAEGGETSTEGSTEGGEGTTETEPPTDTPTPMPPTDTSTPVPPTNTPVPPPPPTNTPVPPPPAPTNTPAPPPPPANTGPTVVIELPDGDTYATGEKVRLIITVSDPDGVSTFSWGVFTENKVGVTGGDQDCGNAPSCRIEETFDAALPGAFQIGVEALDAVGTGVIQVAQLYVG